MLHEQRDVLFAIAKRRNLDGDDVQPIEQVLAELTVGDHLREIAVGGGDDADVDFDRVRVADALELALLQRAQQLGLQRRAHRPHFVEEERSLVRLLEATLAVADRPGERAAHVAEEIRFEQRLGDRAAVERDEPLTAARAVVMNRARHDFLAGAGLAGDQDRAVGRRNRLEQLEETLHHRALADEPFEAVALLELRAQVRVLRFQPPLLERGVERVQQLVDLKRLADEIPRASLDRFDRVLHGAEPGDNDGDDVGVARDGRLEHLGSVDARQAQVGDDDVEREIGQPAERRLAGLGLRDLVAVVGQLLGNRLTERCLVFDEEDVPLKVRHRVRQHFDITSLRSSEATAQKRHRKTWWSIIRPSVS